MEARSQPQLEQDEAGDDVALSPTELAARASIDQKTPEELKLAQQQMEEKVYQIWTVLSAFEESSAGCISEMLLHVSNGAYYDGVQMAEKFILHVEILFTAIDDLEAQMREVGDQNGAYLFSNRFHQPGNLFLSKLISAFRDPFLDIL